MWPSVTAGGRETGPRPGLGFIRGLKGRTAPGRAAARSALAALKYALLTSVSVFSPDGIFQRGKLTYPKEPLAISGAMILVDPLYMYN